MAFVFFLLYLALTYLRPYEFYPQLAVYRPMLLVGGLCLLITFVSIPLSRFTFRAKQVYLVPLFAIWTAATLVLALRWFGGAVSALNELAITMIAFVLATFSVNSEQRLRITTALLVGLAVFLVVLDFLALHFGIFRQMLIMEQLLENGDVALRAHAAGFMKDPNDLSQTLLATLPFVALAWHNQSPIRSFLLVVIPTVILLYGMYLTGSRGGVLGLLALLFLAIRPKLGNLVSGVSLAIGALGVLAMSIGGRGFSSDESVIGRLEAWSLGLQLLRHHPLTGIGYRQFTEYNPITAHNSFVLCFAELGLPGYFLWIALLVITVLELNVIQKLPVKNEADYNLRRIARAIQLSLYSFLISAWFLSRTYVVTLYLLIALAIAVSEIARRNGKPVDQYSVLNITVRTGIVMVASILLVYLQVRIQIR